jgi:hypothetical protein
MKMSFHHEDRYYRNDERYRDDQRNEEDYESLAEEIDPRQPICRKGGQNNNENNGTAGYYDTVSK